MVGAGVVGEGVGVWVVGVREVGVVRVGVTGVGVTGVALPVCTGVGETVELEPGVAVSGDPLVCVGITCPMTGGVVALSGVGEDRASSRANSSRISGEIGATWIISSEL